MKAIALYRGPLLEGWNVEWLLVQRESSAQSYLHALETLARQYGMSLQLGPPVILDSEEMRIVRDRFREYGSTRLASRLPDR